MTPTPLTSDSFIIYTEDKMFLLKLKNGEYYTCSFKLPGRILSSNFRISLLVCSAKLRVRMV